MINAAAVVVTTMINAATADVSKMYNAAAAVKEIRDVVMTTMMEVEGIRVLVATMTMMEDERENRGRKETVAIARNAERVRQKGETERERGL